MIRSRLGLADGDLIEVKVRSTSIVLTPKVVIDRSKFPNADGDYTPAQRRMIDARLARADEDIRRGRLYGPFDTHEQFLASLHKEAKKLRAKKRKRPAE